jgi:tetratricopeptide (TPR) repeat protein
MLQSYIRFIFVVSFAGVIAACTSQSTFNKSQSGAGEVPEYYNEAIAAAKEGKTERAIVLLEKVTKGNPDYAIAFTYLGLQHLQKEDLTAADIAFNRALALDPSDYVAYNHRGVIMRMQGDFNGAKKMYLSAIDKNPDYANAHLNIAVLYDIYLYELDSAMRHYKKYQSLTGDEDKLVAKWIVDLDRRITAKSKK